MTKKEFKALTGEDPEDMFGGDWENEIGELLKWEIQNDFVNSNKPEEDEEEEEL